jgi:cysteine synthase A
MRRRVRSTVARLTMNHTTPDRRSMLAAIGNTPLVRLSRIVPAGSADVWVKLEYYNPTGSYKDRMALSMVERAEQRGTLEPGMTVVEYTGGSTGISLAFVCAVKGYRCRIVCNDAVAKEKLRSMQIFGAQLDVLESQGGKLTADLVPRMMERAREIAAEGPSYATDQMRNPDMLAGYEALGEELLRQVPGPVHAFCAAVGTSGMLMGTARVLRRANSAVRVYAFEPATSAVLSGGTAGAHGVEGVAPGFVPPQFDRSLVTDTRGIDESEARRMTRTLARQEGIFAGTSTGVNVTGALAIARELGPGHNVVTVAVDSGLKYLAGDLYA